MTCGVTSMVLLAPDTTLNSVSRKFSLLSRVVRRMCWLSGYQLAQKVSPGGRGRRRAFREGHETKRRSCFPSSTAGMTNPTFEPSGEKSIITEAVENGTDAGAHSF